MTAIHRRHSARQDLVDIFRYGVLPARPRRY